jgi:hypothetical protein
VQRIAVVANLRPGAADEASRLIEAGPPFDLHASGLDRHTVFLGSDTAVFVFEGGNPQAVLRALSGVSEQSILGEWESLVDGTPKITREAYAWVSPEYAHQSSWGE